MALPFDFDSAIPDQDLASELFEPPSVPRTLREALLADELTHRRNQRIRDRLQSRIRIGFLHRSSALA